MKFEVNKTVNFRCGGAAKISKIKYETNTRGDVDYILCFNNGSVEHKYSHDGLVYHCSAIFDIVEVK